MSRVSSSTYVANAGSISYDGAGTVTAASNCQNNATWAIDVCTALTGTLLTGIVPVAVDGAGGFDLTDPNTRTVTGRLFAFKAGSGDLMQASVGTKGELFFFAPAIMGVPPAVGFASARWDLDSLASFLSASTIYATGSTVTAVDTTAGSWTRTQTLVGSATTHPETLYANTPRAGYVYRPAATVTDSSGAQITVNTFTSQSMPGMGFSPLILVTASGTKLFELSGRQP